MFRCSHAHGDEIPAAFSVILSPGDFGSKWKLAHGELHMPDRVMWGLLAIAVFSRVNYRERSTGTYELTLGTDRFPLSEWWGREMDFRHVAEKYNKTRLTMNGLDRLQKNQREAEDNAAHVIVVNPPFLP